MPVRLLQGIAAGLLGTHAFDGGFATAALGLFFQFVIAFSTAAVFCAMSRVVSFLVTHAAISGVLFGAAVYFFMQRIALPLSLAVKNPFSLKFMLIGIIIHIFCVGLPIALAVRRFSVGGPRRMNSAVNQRSGR